MDTSLGALLRRHRVAAGLTQEALAEQARISVQAVGALERGDRRFPHQATVDRLVDALELADGERDSFALAARRRGVPKAAPGAVPRQLPPGLTMFTGRVDHVRTLLELFDRSPATLCAATGMAGVGKTALALHVGHLVAPRYPDGQVFVDLRGATEPLTASQAIALILRALGVRTDGMASDPAVAGAQLRTCLADRRVLLVLDNAASAEQVRPLLPGSGESGAIITSRRTLHGLPQVHHLQLDVMSEADAVELLVQRAGPRVAADHVAAGAVVRHCDRLPLAVQLVGARLASRPGWTLSELAERLSAQHRRLDQLETGDVGVRASFAVSVDHLDKADSAAFAVLGSLAGPMISVPVAARVLDRSEREAEQQLERLTDHNLLQPGTPGQYRMHDLLQAYAGELFEEAIDAAGLAAARVRLLELLVAVAWRGLRLAAPTGVRASWASADWVDGAPSFASSAESFAWLDDHRHLLAAVTWPGVPGELVVRLGIGLFLYFLSRGYVPEWPTVASAALSAASRTDDRLARGIARMDLGIALARGGSGELRPARRHLEASVEELRALGDANALAMCLINTGDVLESVGDFASAIAYGEEALAVSLRSPAGFPGGEGVAYANLGGLYGKAGDHVTELAYYERGLVLCEKIGYTVGTVDVLRRLGVCHLSAGRPDDTLAVLERGLALCRSHGYVVEEAATRHQLGLVLSTLGRRREAVVHWTVALDSYERDGEAAAAAELRQLLPPDGEISA